MQFHQATTDYLNNLNTPRRRGPLSANSQRIYSTYAKMLAAEFGALDVTLVRNGKVRSFIARLRSEAYSPATINGIFKVLRAILGSVRDTNGARLYAANLQDLTDLEFINLPLLEKKDEVCASVTEVEKAIALGLPVVAFLAASGLRISECLALSVGTDGDCYNPATGTIHIRKTLKTPSAERSIPLPSAFVKWFSQFVPSSGPLFPTTTYQRLHDQLKTEGLPTPHAFRRFKITHLSEAGVNPSVIRALAGHSEKTITDRYDKAGKHEEFVRAQVEMAGLGFVLPRAEEQAA